MSVGGKWNIRTPGDGTTNTALKRLEWDTIYFSVFVNFTILLIGNDKSGILYYLAARYKLKNEHFTALSCIHYTCLVDKKCYPIFFFRFLFCRSNRWRFGGIVHFSDDDVRWCENVDHHQQLNHHLIAFRLLLMKRPANQRNYLTFGYTIYVVHTQCAHALKLNIKIYI